MLINFVIDVYRENIVCDYNVIVKYNTFNKQGRTYIVCRVEPVEKCLPSIFFFKRQPKTEAISKTY